MDRRLLLVIAALVGVAVGLGVFTFGYARGASYLSHDPAACANCHIMREHFAAWMKGSHHSVATCNDCHTPPDLVGKYLTKGRNGFYHSFYFTTGRFAYPLTITPRNHGVTEAACRHCHAPMTDALELGSALRAAGVEASTTGLREPEDLSCVRCHRYVGHWVR